MGKGAAITKVGVDPYQRLRSIAAYNAIRDGRIKVPIVCGQCQSPSVMPDEGTDHDPNTLICLKCGAKTKTLAAREVRRRKVKQIVNDGIDISRPS